MLKDFATLYLNLLIEKNPSIRSFNLKSYLNQVPDEDKRMAIHLLNSYKSKSTVKRSDLTQWLIEFTNLPDWLIRESHTVTGDWPETFSLVIGNVGIQSSGLSLDNFVGQLEQLRSSKDEIKEFVQSMWQLLSPHELFLFHKLLLGSYRAIKEKKILTSFLAEHYDLDFALISLRLMKFSNQWPSFSSLVNPEWLPEEALAKPYSFNLPVIYEAEIHLLGPTEHWYAEPFTPGQRVQVIRRDLETYLWSIDFSPLVLPSANLNKLFEALPQGIVLDGIIQSGMHTPVISDGLGPEMKKDEFFRFILLDILEWKNKDVRNTPLDGRKQIIDAIAKQINHKAFIPVVYHEVSEWKHITPDFYPEGWVLKRKDGLYDAAENRWWRFKSIKKEMYTILMYAEILPQQNQVYLCTFGIYNDEQTLVPIVKLSSDQLGEAQVTQLHYWIQNNVIQKFGPVRVVRPHQLFLIVFDKSTKNPRLKAGYTLKNAQIKKWETIPSADHKIGSLEQLKNLS